ncbi:centrosomal protein of 55 kDa-like isoform X2 [Clinocottus analis]|uniref:centrosomal protein of 55 kDa-like isoform X2 n=1 Tax=Clinocottus analis TaxID=304258 RepID=UPI0035BFAE58
MASPRFNRSSVKKLNSTKELDVVIISSLKKENAYLKKTLVELTRQQSEHNRVIEKLIFLETVRLESCQQLTTKDEKTSLPEPLSEKEEKQMAVESTSDKCPSTTTAMQQCDVLEKNKQWLEYDQQREASGRATLARMLWLEKQLNEAHQALLQQHNEGHSNEKEKIGPMQEHYERLLKKAKDELEVLREKFNMTDQKLKITQKWCMEREMDVEEFQQRLQAETMSKTGALGDHYCSEDEEQWLSAETKNLQCRLDDERRKRFSLNCHHADQEKIAKLERQIQISSQDLEDEKQNCSYLKKQMVRILKSLQKPREHVTKQSKRDQQDRASCKVDSCKADSCEADSCEADSCEADSYEATSCEAVSLETKDSLTWSPPRSLLNESFLECPSCQAEYPASHYRELMSHLEICLK